jgi:hypothetical protein
MKQKVHYHVQPRQNVPPDAQVQREIQNFLHALDSYPARAAKQPSVTFQEHLCSISAAVNDNDRSDNDRSDNDNDNNDNARHDTRNRRQ